jgi:SPP1 family predicted phage head-tail adaptor
MYNDVISLLTITQTVNEIGDTIESITKSDVFAMVKSVGMREKYEALNVGLKPELVFELADYYDYADQEHIEYDGKRYKVLRTYRKESNELEIVVTR